MSSLVTIERKKLDANRCYGVIVKQTPVLTLLHYEYDFQFDGYMVIRTKDMTLCDSSESNDYCARLMRREGLWEPVPRWVKKLDESANLTTADRFVPGTASEGRLSGDSFAAAQAKLGQVGERLWCDA
jgi:hypothetical protein